MTASDYADCAAIALALTLAVMGWQCAKRSK